MQNALLAAVRDLHSEWSDAFERRDIDRLVALYAPHAAFWGSTNDLHTGPEGVRRYFMKLSPAYKRSHYEAPYIVRLGPDALSASGYVVFVKEVEGKDVGLPYRMTHVLVRLKGTWKIATHHASPQFIE